MNPSFDQIIKSIEQLRQNRKGFDNGWTRRGRPNGEAPAHDDRSAKSLRWLHEKREKYSGQ
jgi:hypothetical protein